jgi:hypothetical protein
MKRYNISYNEYLEMLKIYSICPICNRNLDSPVIDHDHENGKVRGIICCHCNSALNIIENPIKLKRALQYLERSKI